MLKVIGSEAVGAYYKAQRLAYLLTRAKNVASAEPKGPQVGSNAHRRILYNDVSAY